jgi:AcrR family transcriptional regulator
MDPKDKRARILRATLELITDHGFHGTPVSMIADRAAVGAGTIYRYFENKEAILTELYDVLQRDLHEATMAGIPADVSVRDEFSLKWRNILRYFLENPYEAKFLEQYSASPFISPRVMEENAKRNAHLRVLRQRGIDTGVLRPVEYQTLAIFLWGLVKEVHHQSDAGSLAVTESLIEEIFSVFWEGVRAR